MWLSNSFFSILFICLFIHLLLCVEEHQMLCFLLNYAQRNLCNIGWNVSVKFISFKINSLLWGKWLFVSEIFCFVCCFFWGGSFFRFGFYFFHINIWVTPPLPLLLYAFFHHFSSSLLPSFLPSEATQFSDILVGNILRFVNFPPLVFVPTGDAFGVIQKNTKITASWAFFFFFFCTKINIFFFLYMEIRSVPR